MRTRFHLISLFIAVMLLGGAAHAQTIPAAAPYLTATADLTTLLATAERTGSVRVIVGLHTAAGQPSGGSLSDFARVQAAADAQDALLDTLGSTARVIRRFHYLPYLVIEADASGLQALAMSPLVAHLQADGYSLPQLNGSALQIGAAGPGGAWDMGYTGSGRVIAVLDSGVATRHPAFAGALLAEACFSSNGVDEDGISTYTSLCPGGAPTATGPGSGRNCRLSVFNCEHGSLIAGTIASRDATYRGIAPDAQIVSVQIFTRVDGPLCNNLGYPSPCAITRISDQVAALEHLYWQRAAYRLDAVTLSVGAGLWNSVAQCDADNAVRKAATALLADAGIPVFAPTGNGGVQGAMLAPACLSTVIAVGAVNNADGVTTFSNVAPFMDFFAPGKAIHSTIPGGGFADQDGTSMAAPQVAAVYTLLKSAAPDLTPTQLLNTLRMTGPLIASSAGNFPRVDIRAALQARAVLLVAPQRGEILAGQPPVFQWRRLMEAARYRLVVTNTITGVAITHTLDAADCAADPCTLALPEIYAPGTVYRWRVRAFTPGGRRDSLRRMFTVSTANPASLQHPADGAELSTLHELRWTPVAGAAFYRVVLHDSNGTRLINQKFTATCAETCTLPLTAAQIALLTPGAYNWRVVTVGQLGRAPSASSAFTLASPPLRRSSE